MITLAASAKEICTKKNGYLMESSEKIFELLKDLLAQLPSLLVMLGCMIVAIVRWRRHPKVSLLVLLSLALMMLQGIFYAVVYTWVPDWFLRAVGPASTEMVARNVYLVLGLFSNGTLAIGLILLLAAIFTQRGLPKEA